MRNTCINQKVRERVEERYRQEMLNGETEEFDWENDDALEELRKLLLDAIDRLPEKCREIFVLSKMEGLSNKQISEQLNISIKTVEAQMTTAFVRLRKELGWLLCIILFQNF